MTQRERAMRKANATRRAVADMKERLARLPQEEAVAEAARVLRDPSGPEGAVRVDQLLRAIPRFGPVRVRLTLRHAGLVGDARLVRRMPRPHRERVARALTAPLHELRRPGPIEPVVDPYRVTQAAAALRARRPDVHDPRDVARIVLEFDDYARGGRL